jgi:hypothetical protein
MRAVFALLLACSDAPRDPHAAGSCDQGWVNNGFDTCELGCENSGIALAASGASCDAETIEGISVSCSKTLVFDGVTGCCSVDPPEVHFAACL